ncbi:MAG TPA: Crp/Fnr family transcriptional regulator [Solirubrobacteraceae bacterium]
MAPGADERLLATALRREGRLVQISHGQALFVEGDRAERVFLLQRGWVIISCVGAGGREVVLGVSGPGDVIGELSAFDEQPRSATAVAADDVEAVVAPAWALTKALDNLGAAHELIAVLAVRVRDDTRKLVEFATLSTLGRIAWRLLELSDRFGEPVPDGIAVSLPLSQDQLASWCGASREAAVRALRSLRTLGIISTGRHSVIIRDLDGLRRQAQGLA